MTSSLGTRDPWRLSIDHLRTAGPKWSGIIERIGPCLLRPRRDRFGTLVRAIIGQQISTKAAASIDAKLRLAQPLNVHDPASLVVLGETGLRACGLSGVKARYVLNLTDAVLSNRIPLARIGRLTDEDIIERLTEVKGIGRWTAEMFLIFALNRPDVLPVHDLGVRVGLRDLFELPDLPKPAHCHELTTSWRPHRTVAMWYLWRLVEASSKKKTAKIVSPEEILSTRLPT